ncbi:MAG: TonB-dependent receptor, partial [Anaeromyxobacteraceae bacterium]|nr:TonB-dependent receptor [Anaeromyxobacteraceae bacterium]
GVDLPFAGRRLVEFGPRAYGQKLQTFRVVTGLDGVLSDAFGPLRGWAWEAALNYGRSGGTFTTTGAIRNSRIADAVGPSFDLNGTPVCGSRGPDGVAGTADDVIIPGCVPINLFGGPNNGSIDPAQIVNLGFTGTSRAEDSIVAVSVNADGELVALGEGRAVTLAVGYEHRRQAGAQVADPIAESGDSADFNFKSTAGSFSADEAYAELTFPLLSGVPGAHALELSAALRYVDYNTFGGNTSYKVGARWAPVPDVTLRGTFSTAFRAPTIGELFLGQAETAPNATDPCNYDPVTASQALKDQCAANGAPNPTGDLSNQVLTRQGGNPDLEAETAKVFTAGAVLTPRFDPNLSVTLDYYHLQVDNLVSVVGTPGIIAGCFPAANPDPVIAASAPNQAYCDLIQRASTSGRILFVRDVNQNVGTLKTAGLDAAVRYQLPSRIGRFAFGVEGSFLAYYDRTQAAGGGTVTIHGKGNRDLGALPAFKGNLKGAWALGNGSAGAVFRYVGSFKECSGPDGTSDGGICSASGGDSRQVGSNVVVDLHGGYAVQSVAGKTTASVGINNVFDQKPQYVYSAPLANSDPTLYDYLGRYFYVRLTQTY